MQKVLSVISPIITIDRIAFRPLHGQIYDGYRAAIVGAMLRQGQWVPSTRDLASELGCLASPFLNAPQLLAEGCFQSQVGTGTAGTKSSRPHDSPTLGPLPKHP